MIDRKCAWISCATICTPLVAGGPTPRYCSPLCRNHADGYARWLDGGGEDTADVTIGDRVISIDRNKANERAQHLKRMADAHQEALW